MLHNRLARIQMEPAMPFEIHSPDEEEPVEQNRSREESWMRRSALHYLGQRSTSVANLRRVLARRAKRKLDPEIEQDVGAMIERTVAFCVRNGFVDDAAFVEGRIHSGRSRGLSMRRIGAALGAKGVDRTLVAQAFDTDDRDEREEAAALRLAQRKRLGPWRRLDREYDTQKEVAVMARGGFSISLAKRIVGLSVEEAEEIESRRGGL
jgi:regulatory protein